MNHDIFISYSSQQKNIADGVCHYLEENGFKCWMAPRDIPVGGEYGDLIEEAIKTCKVVVLVFSEAASISKWVKGEINVAFAEDKPILPFRLDETEIKGGFRVMLNQMHWIDAFPQYADRLPDLLNSVCGLLGHQPPKFSDESNRIELKERRGTNKKWFVVFDVVLIVCAYLITLLLLYYRNFGNLFMFDLNHFLIVPITYLIAFLIAHIYDKRINDFNLKDILRILYSCLGAGSFLFISKVIVAQLSVPLMNFIYPRYSTLLVHCFITFVIVIIVRYFIHITSKKDSSWHK